jgi:hypothetical protein
MVIAMITAARSQPAAIHSPPNTIQRTFRTRLVGDMSAPEFSRLHHMVPGALDWQ